MSAVVDPDPAQRPALATRYAQFASGLTLAQIPEAVQARAKLCILDALGTGLAGSAYPFAEKTANALGALGGRGASSVIALPLSLPLRDAVMLNGTLIHGLDYDDTHGASIVHASASAVPTVLGMAEARHSSGADALLAYLIAVECAARIGRVAEGGFQKVGFHPTGVVGCFGASLAAGRLLQLDVQTLVMTQGIALSFASGSLEFLSDGAWTKRIHPGWAAAAGITAATLAEHGFLGPGAPYEGRFGLYNAYLGTQRQWDLDSAREGLGEVWETANMAIKPYPVCHFNHACADAVLHLMQQHDVTADQIKSMTGRIHAEQLPVVCEPEAAKRRPVSDYDAKFSLPFVMAASAVRGRFTLDELEEDALHDTAILELCDRVRCEPMADSAYPRYYSGEVVIETRDGATFTHVERINRGADARPLAASDITAKFLDNAQRVLAPADAQAVVEQVLALEEQPDLSALWALLRR
jgi:2-methylcitrate dehydratase PrpD